jgi:hypothetical protein
MVAVVVIIVTVVPPVMASQVTATVIPAPTREALTNRIRHTVAPDKLTARLAVRGGTNSALALPKGQIFHYLQMVAQGIDMAALEVDRVIVVWGLPVWLGDGEGDFGGDVARVTAPSP